MVTTIYFYHLPVTNNTHLKISRASQTIYHRQ